MKSSGNDSSQIALSSRAESSIPTTRRAGVVRADVKGYRNDSVTRRLAHEPFGWRLTTLLVTVRRYRCTSCGHVWRHTRRGDKYVTVIIDLTAVRAGTGPPPGDLVSRRASQRGSSIQPVVVGCSN